MPLATSIVQTALPFVLFAAFLVVFALRGRQRGMTAREYVDDRNRRTFTARLKPGWWRIHVAWALFLWIVLFVASGFQLVLLAILPPVVLAVPLWTLVVRRLYGRRAG